MAEHLQYRYHGRFISAGDAARLANLKGASAYVSTSYQSGRSHTHIASYAPKETARAILKDEIAERRAAKGLPPLEKPAPERPAPSRRVEPEGGFGEIPPSAEFPREELEELFEPEFDYEKQGFESPWADDKLFKDDLWDDMDWDGDVADIDDDVYIQIGS